MLFNILREHCPRESTNRNQSTPCLMIEYKKYVLKKNCAISLIDIQLKTTRTTTLKFNFYPLFIFAFSSCLDMYNFVLKHMNLSLAKHCSCNEFVVLSKKTESTINFVTTTIVVI